MFGCWPHIAMSTESVNVIAVLLSIWLPQSVPMLGCVRSKETLRKLFLEKASLMYSLNDDNRTELL